jgi:hypothetical protein
MVGINQGRLGFITDVPIGQFAEALAPIIAGDYEEERRTMLEGNVFRDDQKIFDGFAMNDVVVSRSPSCARGNWPRPRSRRGCPPSRCRRPRPCPRPCRAAAAPRR